MKNKIISLLLIGICSFGLIGCNNDTVNKNTQATSENRFISTNDNYVISGWRYEIFYDSITKIVYIECGGSQGSGITVIYNSEGQPMTLDEYNESK
ncbi:hypothetical protein [Clostridium botulinum]|uniref:hypothetical protein n=1 Tax=Clostridium botulinum TaxID=1491 RepID=UPI001C9B35BC|nr:hypothetical protein [Clostridium botulinum]MBY6838742.1 hypothetical protein [Clostridium botulinum]